MEIFEKKYNVDIDTEKTIAELIEQIKQIEISIFYTLLNFESEIAYLLSTDDFYSSWSKRYIRAIHSLISESSEVNAITVFDRLKELKIAEDSDFARLIEFQTATATVAGTKTVEVLKKYTRQLKAWKKLQELQQKVLENIENSDDIDIESLKDEYFEFIEHEKEQEKKYITNDEILQCIKNQDFEQRWLFKDFILSNSINIIDGRGGAKKSRFSIQLSIHTVAQLDFLCFPHSLKEIGVDFKNVLYLTTKSENNPNLLSNLVNKICSFYELNPFEILNHLFFIQSPQTLLKKSSKGIEPTKFFFELKNLSRKYKPDLIVIDPLARFMGVEFTNENIAVFYNYLEQLNSSILIVHHQPKSNTNKEIEETTSLGGVMFRELARARFILKENELMIEKNNMSKYYGHIVKLSYDYHNCIFTTTQKEPFEKECIKTLEQHKGNGKNGKKY